MRECRILEIERKEERKEGKGKSGGDGEEGKRESGAF